MEGKTHELKVWSEYFTELLTGKKNFELRKNDRDFKAGDTLHLKDYSPELDEYSGWEIECTVTYILHGGQFGLEEGYVIMGLGAAKGYKPF